MPTPLIPTGPQHVVTFQAENWDGPHVRPLYGADYVEKTPRAPQRLKLDVLTQAASWIFTLSGEATYRKGEHNYRLTPGTVLVYLYPDDGIIRHPPKGKKWHHVWLAFSGEHALAVARHVMRRHGQIHHIPLKAACVREARALLREARLLPKREARYWSVKTHHWLNAWWGDAETHSVSLLSALHTKTAANSALLTAGSLKNMARQLGYSRSYLSRRLKGMWDGVPPGALLRVSRLDEGARLLRTGDLSVSEIATQIGYARAGSFIAAFRVHYGKTPLRYRHDRMW